MLKEKLVSRTQASDERRLFAWLAALALASEEASAASHAQKSAYCRCLPV